MVGRWWRSRPQAGLGISANAVVAVMNGGELRSARRQLPDGLVQPDAINLNVGSVSELAQLATAALTEVGAVEATVALALPDLSVTTRVLHPTGRENHRELAAVLEESLPYPRSEGRYDFWSGPGGSVVGAAVRTAIARQYEQVIEAAACRVGWVDGTCLAQLPLWSEVIAGGSGLHLRIQLQPASYCVAVFVDRKLADVRIKLRPRNLEAIQHELERIPALHGISAASSVHFFGPDADALAEGRPEPDVRSEPADPLDSAVKTLLQRRTR